MTAISYRRVTIGYAARVAGQLLRSKISDQDLRMLISISQFLLFVFSLGGAHATIILTLVVHPIFLVPTGVTFFGFLVLDLKLMENLQEELHRREESAQRVAQFVKEIEAELGLP